MKQFKGPGRRVINYEYKNYKRVLQSKFSKRWRGVNLGAKAFFRRLYRMDAQGREDFAPLINEPAAKPTPATTTQRMQSEYLQVVLRENTFYSVDLEQSTTNGPDVGAIVPLRMFFNILGTRTSQQKPKLVDTYRSGEQVSGLTLHMQPFDVWRTDAFDAIVSVFPEADAEWMHALDLAPFARLEHNLNSWDDTVSAYAGCFELSNMKPAVPMLALTDQRCPTITIVGHLMALGWVPHDGLFTHVSATDLRFDGRKPSAQKNYLQVLVMLTDMLRGNPIHTIRAASSVLQITPSWTIH
jgi:hypothetical protein